MEHVYSFPPQLTTCNSLLQSLLRWSLLLLLLACFPARLSLVCFNTSCHYHLLTNILHSSGCATSCITNANLDGCSATDDVCLCNDQTFVNSVTNCIVNACTGADLANAVATAEALCAAVVCNLLHMHVSNRPLGLFS